MDIHKPKPWHGAREFLKEYLIIAVGVLTALAAEQAVEWAHTHEEVAAARSALHHEMSGDLQALVVEVREDGCWLRGLDTVEAWGKTQQPKPAWPGNLLSNLRTSAWDVAKTGAVAHMDLAERLALADFYAGVDNQRSLIMAARGDALDLEGYLNRDSLDPEEAHALIRLVARVRGIARAEIRNAPGMLAAGRKLGIEPSGETLPVFKARVDALCAAFPERLSASS
jgi:hypothetical protein